MAAGTPRRTKRAKGRILPDGKSVAIGIVLSHDAFNRLADEAAARRLSFAEMVRRYLAAGMRVKEAP